MTEKPSFQERYKTKNTPWEINRPDNNLINIVTNMPIKACKAIDIGCGTGNNAIWLAKNGFEVCGCDISDIAIERAEKKAVEADVECSFLVLDFLADTIPGKPFNFAFDRGCFHVHRENGRLNQYAGKVAATLDVHGLWLTLTGNADENRDGEGPPQLSAIQITSAVEPHFEILSLSSGHFDSNMEPIPRNWICLMKKRG